MHHLHPPCSIQRFTTGSDSYPPGLLIFVIPGSVSQLAVGFVIAAYFLLVHLGLYGYQNVKQNRLQLCSMLSLSMTLFAGILLKTEPDDEDVYGRIILEYLLIGMNFGIMFMFVIQMALRPKQGMISL